MAPLPVLIIDHDLRACELLRDNLTRVAPETWVLAELHSAAAAEQRLAQNDYDIVFLDVQLPVGNGFDLVPFVRAEAAIIFVAARDDHAVRAFEVNAVDYILKPVTAARLTEALNRAAQKVQGRRTRFSPLT